MDLQTIDVHFHLNQLDAKESKSCSQLGFFSKPYKICVDSTEVILKRYHPIKRNVKKIIKSHNDYIGALRTIGVNVPDTRIASIKRGSKQELIIFQLAFKENELLRANFSKKPLKDLLQYLVLLYNETINFQKKASLGKIGFHPTLRNYAIKNGKPHYFDTFPPMNMEQLELNKLIKQMSPIPNWTKFLVPVKAINRVSDEYYDVSKMLLGILGSSIRLRPEYIEEFLRFTKNYIENSSLPAEEKEGILGKINTPPKLSFLWRFVRKLTGNIGQPNVALSK